MEHLVDWILAIENILWRCVVKARVIFLSRQIFLINQKHISTLSHARNTARKNKWKNIFLYFFLSFLTSLIRDECRILREKSRRNENDYAFWWCPYSLAVTIQKFHFLSKNDVLKITFDSHQMHTKNQAIEGRRIYVRIIF